MKLSETEIRELTLKQFKDMRCHSCKEVGRYISENSTKSFDMSQVHNVLLRLKRNNEIQHVKRGVYKIRTENSVEDFKILLRECLQNTLMELSAIFKGVDVILLNNEDFEKMQCIRDLAEQIQKVANTFSESQTEEADTVGETKENQGVFDGGN